jgi:GH43 family beta-xylosidase
MDPTAGSWELLGPVKGLHSFEYTIDSTVIIVDGKHYLVFSAQSFDEPEEQGAEPDQQLFIALLSDALTPASTPVVICRPDRAFERSGNHGSVEAPHWLESPDFRWRGLVYSCSASWTKEYKMNTLRFLGGNPLNPESWQKSDIPLLQSAAQGPYGPGHGCFLNLHDSTIAFFHATDHENDGPNKAKCRMQRVRWTADGPCMDGVIGPALRNVDLFTKLGTGVKDDVEEYALRPSNFFVPMDLAQAMVGPAGTQPTPPDTWPNHLWSLYSAVV